MGAKCFPLNSRSKTYGLIGGTGGAGYPVRMRVEWPGNTENAAKTSAWAYLKFVH